MLRYWLWVGAAFLSVTQLACETVDRCKTKPDCSALGKCTSGDSGRCIAASVADCTASKLCKEKGQCTAREGACVVGGDQDCASSEACTKLGNCSVYAGVCHDPKQATHAECRETCEDEGLCVTQGGTQGGQCVALSARHCRGTLADKAVKGSPCDTLGQCSAEAGKCVAAADEACATSVACKTSSQCKADRGRCVATAPGCKNSDSCTRDGQCGEQDGKCVATKSTDCRNSLRCKLEGTCTAKDGACSAAASADCAGSTNCKQANHCTAKAGVCVASADRASGLVETEHKEINTKLGGIWGQ